MPLTLMGAPTTRAPNPNTAAWLCHHRPTCVQCVLLARASTVAEQLAAMSATAASAKAEAQQTSKKLDDGIKKVRRTSRDLEADFFGMSLQSRKEIDNVFDQYDTDHSGGISHVELTAALSKLKDTAMPSRRAVSIVAAKLGYSHLLLPGLSCPMHRAYGCISATILRGSTLPRLPLSWGR